MNPIERSSCIGVIKTILREDRVSYGKDYHFEELLAAQDFSTEIIQNKEIHATLVRGVWGDVMTLEEHARAVAEHCNADEKAKAEIAGLIASTGSTQTRWTRYIQTREEALQFEVAVGKTLVEKAVQQEKINVAAIDQMIVASSTSLSPLLPHYIKSAAGMDRHTAVEVSSLACASSAEAFDRLLEAPATDETWRLLVCVEPLTLFRIPYDEWATGTKDHLALSMFGDEAFVFLFQPNKWKKMISIQEEQYDEEGALAARVPSKYLRHEGETVLFTSDWGQIGKLPEPKTKELITLLPRGTTELFSKFIKQKMVPALENRLQVLYKRGIIPSPDLSWVSHAIAHRPSKLIYEKGIKKALVKLGLPEHLLSWDLGGKPIPMNAPAATFGVELSRVLPSIKNGETLLTFFFGAGAYGRSGIYQVR